MANIETAVIHFNDVSQERVSLPVPTMLPIKVVAERTGLSYECLRQLCINGEIVHIRTGAKYLINWERLIDYLNKNKGGESVDGILQQ